MEDGERDDWERRRGSWDGEVKPESCRVAEVKRKSCRVEGEKKETGRESLGPIPAPDASR